MEKYLNELLRESFNNKHIIMASAPEITRQRTSVYLWTLAQPNTSDQLI
jgi:hypothetical protein